MALPSPPARQLLGLICLQSPRLGVRKNQAQIPLSLLSSYVTTFKATSQQVSTGVIEE